MQVLTVLLSGTLWVPYLRTLPVSIVLGTIFSTLVSFLVTKSGPLRYFFGLPGGPGSLLPGKKLRGLAPVLVLTVLLGSAIIVANIL